MDRMIGTENKVLAVIPARSGSKRLPNKNIKIFCGKPLLVWTIEAALNSKCITKVILSSNDQEAIEIATSQGCEVPFIRPDHLATDEASSLDVIRHALDFFEDHYQYVILLQPTSPLRTAKDIDASLKLMQDKRASICISFCLVDKPLHWHYLYDEKGGLSRIGTNKEGNSHLCYPNGAIYIFSTEWIRNNSDYMSERITPYFMPYSRSIDIDTYNDWCLAEYFNSIQED